MPLLNAIFAKYFSSHWTNTCSELNICVYTTYIYKIKISVSFQKDLDALLEKDKTLEEESKNLSELLAKQKEKYALLQVKGHLMMMMTKRVWVQSKTLDNHGVDIQVHLYCL